MAGIVLSLPFDEASGSAVAYDRSASGADGVLSSGTEFVTGGSGNALQFENETQNCVVAGTTLGSLDGDFTLVAVVKASSPASGTFRGFLWAIEYGIAANVTIDASAGAWHTLQLIRSGSSLRFYLDSVLQQTVTISGTLVGLALTQYVSGSQYGTVLLDDFKIYDYAIAIDDDASAGGGTTDSGNGGYDNSGLTVRRGMITYSLDGVDFKDFDVYVSDSSGLLDRPKMKTPLSQDWDDYHGTTVDLSRIRLQSRTITLKCFIYATGKYEFVSKLNDFLAQFDAAGTRRLMVEISDTGPLVYEVYLADAVTVSGKRWSDDLMAGSFTLKLTEPDPVKKVLRHQRTGSDTASLTMSFTSARAVTIYWGDGTVTEDLYGAGVSANHEYETDGVYYAIVAGVIDEITDFATNGTVVWNRI